MNMNDDTLILSEAFRAKVIKEINGPENQARKAEHKKRQDLYKDKIKEYVIEQFRKEKLSPATVDLISNRATAVNILKKVINKLSRSYLGDVKRDFKEDAEKFSELDSLIDMSSKMRKADRLEKLHNNCLMGVIPKSVYELSDDVNRFVLDIPVLAPYQYDVIEDAADREKARCVILSDTYATTQSLGLDLSQGADGVDQVIADHPDDHGKPKGPEYIFWTKTYHLTCDAEGKLIKSKSPLDLLNPIQMMPWVTVSEKQDGAYYAQGGNDLIDGTILVNTILTDMIAIANIQGWGQLVITGSNIPDTISGGPHKAIVIEQRSGDPAPSVSFQSANPPLDAWAQMVEQYVALLLTTNDLSPGQVSAKLDAASPASGVSLMIDRSEALDNVADRQKMFKLVERKLWSIAAAWQNLLFDANLLIDDFYALGQLPMPSVSLKFHEARATLTEKERLENMKARHELGIVSIRDLIKTDNPDMTDEEVEQKVLYLESKKMEKVASQAVDVIKELEGEQ